MKLASYVRVSTDKQAEDGLGLEVQHHEIGKWAKTHDHRVALSFADEGISGSEGLDRRLGLADALDAVRSRQVQGLVVYRLDRLSRDAVLQEQLLRDIWQWGGAIWSTSAGEQEYLKPDPDDPSRKLIRQVFGAVGEYERDLITLRLRAGRRRKAALGGYAHGAPPYGYSAREGRLVPLETEQLIVVRVLEMDGDGLSLRQICEALEREGAQPRRGASWHPQVISRILLRSKSKGLAATSL